MSNSTFSMTDEEYFVLLCQRISSACINVANSYDEYLTLSFVCAEFGETGRQWFHQLSSLDEKYDRQECDRKFDNVLATTQHKYTIATLVYIARQHGIDTSKPRGRRPKSSKQKQKEQENKFRQMCELVCKFCQVRFNVWRNRVEISENGSKWRSLSERDLNTIFTRLQDAGLKVKIGDVNALLGSRDFSEDYDVVRNYLNSLKPYDPNCGKDYIHDFFIGHLQFGDPEYLALYKQMLRKWFVGMVALWLGRADENPLMPVFCGTQHIGKTYFIRHILPPELRDYRKEPNPRDPVDKDFMISLSEVVIIFLDEFSITSAMKSDTYKAIITSTQTNLRDAYGHFREVRYRRASLIGATNYNQFIRDIEGIRRYLAIDLVGTANLNDHPLDYDGAYAQALWLLDNGFDPKPTHEESMLLSQHNMLFLEPNDCEECLSVFLRKPTGEFDGEWMTSGEIFQEMSNRNFRGRGFSTSDIGKAMKRLGFDNKLLKGKTRYRVVIVDYDQQRRERATIDDEDTPVF